MNRFKSFLQEMNRRLDVPQPVKSRIILEISADLNDLFLHYKNKGLPEAEAAEKAKEKFMLTEETLSELTSLHRPVIRRWLEKISQQAAGRWERMMLLIVLLVIFVPGFQQILSSQFFQKISLFSWPILGMALISSTVFLIKFYSLYLKKDHRLSELRNGLSSLLALGGASLFTSMAGYFIELYSLTQPAVLFASNPLLLLILTTNNPHDMAIFQQIPDWMIRTSAMVMIGILASIMAALFWFLLNAKISRIEQAELETLLSE
jgi:hypothetical protein